MDNKNVANKKDESVAEDKIAVDTEQDAIAVEETPEPLLSPAVVTAAEEPKNGGAVSPPAAQHAVVGNGETDDVILSRCVYKNAYARKSLTVHHVQRRLTELGYREADADKDGWYGDGTKNAVADFQVYLGIEGDGTMNADTFAAIFDGDHNVTVIID